MNICDTLLEFILESVTLSNFSLAIGKKILMLLGLCQGSFSLLGSRVYWKR
jgi:hypothetical protein